MGRRLAARRYGGPWTFYGGQCERPGGPRTWSGIPGNGYGPAAQCARRASHGRGTEPFLLGPAQPSRVIAAYSRKRASISVLTNFSSRVRLNASIVNEAMTVPYASEWRMLSYEPGSLPLVDAR